MMTVKLSKFTKPTFLTKQPQYNINITMECQTKYVHFTYINFQFQIKKKKRINSLNPLPWFINRWQQSKMCASNPHSFLFKLLGLVQLI